MAGRRARRLGLRPLRRHGALVRPRARVLSRPLGVALSVAPGVALSVALSVALAAAAASGCTRFVPDAGGDLTALAGKTARVALRAPPPDGAEVRWDAGDGSPTVVGPELAHAWQRPGRYTVGVEAGGARDELVVEVRPRPVDDAVPAGVKLALLVPRPWRSAPRLLALAERFAYAADVRRALSAVEEALGADPTRPERLAEAGIDPDEGLAVVVFPEDPGVAWLLVGTLDDDKAVALGRRVLGAVTEEEKRLDGARILLGRDGAGAPVAWGVAGGYAAIRAPGGESGSPAAALVRLALAAEGSLGSDPEFRRARAMAPGDDAVGYAQPRTVRGLVLAAGREPTESTGALVVGVDLGDEELAVSAALPVEREEAAGILRTFRAGRLPPGFARRLPPGAVAFASISVDPGPLADLLLDDPGVRTRAELGARLLGVELPALLRAVTGNLALAGWFDAGAYLRGEVQATGAGPPQPPSARSLAVVPLLAYVELADPAAAREALVPAFDRLGAAAQEEAGATVFRSDSGVASLSGDVLVLANRAAEPLLGRAADGASPVEGAIGAAILAESGTQAVWVDVAAMLDALRNAEPQPGVDPVRQAFAQALVLARLEALAPVKDVLLTGGATAGGLAARLRVRMRGAEARK